MDTKRQNGITTAPKSVGRTRGRGVALSLAVVTSAALVGGVLAPRMSAAEKEINPYPETRAEIAAYKEHLIRKHHEEISDYPEEVTEISTLEELFEYAGKSRVHVRMRPGVYSIGLDNYQNLWNREKTGSTLLLFSGDNSFYDLSGVTIRIDTAVGNSEGGLTNEVRVTGDNLILEGLTVRLIGRYKAIRSGSWNRGEAFTQHGSNNLLQGVEVVSRGSWPYGYGEWKFTVGYHDILRKARPSTSMRSAFDARGQNNVYADVEIYHRGIGHVLKWRGGPLSHTWIDCIVQGEVRLSDDILNGESGGFYDDRATLPEDLELSEYMQPGRIVPLVEDAFRSYSATGKLKILGCTVRDCRSAIKRGDYEELFVSNTTLSGICGGAFRIGMGQNGRIVNCKVDLAGGILFLYGGNKAEVDITVLPNPYPSDVLSVHTKKKSGIIDGTGGKITLRAGKGLNPEKVKKDKLLSASDYISDYFSLVAKYIENPDQVEPENPMEDTPDEWGMDEFLLGLLGRRRGKDPGFFE